MSHAPEGRHMSDDWLIVCHQLQIHLFLNGIHNGNCSSTILLSQNFRKKQVSLITGPCKFTQFPDYSSSQYIRIYISRDTGIAWKWSTPCISIQRHWYSPSAWPYPLCEGRCDYSIDCYFEPSPDTRSCHQPTIRIPKASSRTAVWTLQIPVTPIAHHSCATIRDNKFTWTQFWPASEDVTNCWSHLFTTYAGTS